MRIYVLLFSCFFGLNQLAISQQNNFWQETSEQAIPTQRTQKELQTPNGEKYFKLNMDALKQVLQNAPKETERLAKNLNVSFPFPDGHVENFIVSETALMAPNLAAKYPSIKTFKGISTDNPLNSIRFDYTPQGFHCLLYTSPSPRDRG